MNEVTLQTPLPQQFTIRPIAMQDDASLGMLVISVLNEFGCVGPGYASSDPELKALSSVYTVSPGEPIDRGYWVIVDEPSQQILGGAGFSRLKGTSDAEGICELQKVYFHPKLRGLGFGRKIIERCIQEATQGGYSTMYLESVPQMESAVGLYEKLGFQFLPNYLGDTGHRSCTVFMSRPLGL
jgi:putative acetyltransferase